MMRSIVHLLAAAVLGPLLALAGDPEVSITRLANLPSRLFYFDDTPVGYHRSVRCVVSLTP